MSLTDKAIRSATPTEKPYQSDLKRSTNMAEWPGQHGPSADTQSLLRSAQSCDVSNSPGFIRLVSEEPLETRQSDIEGMEHRDAGS